LSSLTIVGGIRIRLGGLWMVAVWQNKPHPGLRHPAMPKKDLSPNEAYAALASVAPTVNVALDRDDYIGLLPVTHRSIQAYGINFEGRPVFPRCPARGRTAVQRRNDTVPGVDVLAEINRIQTGGARTAKEKKAAKRDSVNTPVIPTLTVAADFDTSWPTLRWAFTYFVGDLVAYQVTAGTNVNYDVVHRCIDEALAKLAE
jgi:hypothetical protein